MWEYIVYGIFWLTILGIVITACVYNYKSKRAEVSVIVREKSKVSRVAVKCKAVDTSDVRNIIKSIFEKPEINIS